MRIYIILIFLLISFVSNSQGTILVMDDSRKAFHKDSLIKERLVALAMENPAFKEADALIKAAEYELKRAKASWLNSVVISGNLNEFVINNSTINGLPASTLFPKYNFGVNIPFGLFGNQEKNISKERVKLYEAQKESKIRTIRKEVLIRYENYKEKKVLFDLQKQITDGQYSTYQQRQKEFATRETNKVEDVNKEYELWIEQRSKQRTKERELAVAELELEEIIGMKIQEGINISDQTK